MDGGWQRIVWTKASSTRPRGGEDEELAGASSAKDPATATRDGYIC